MIFFASNFLCGFVKNNDLHSSQDEQSFVVVIIGCPTCDHTFQLTLDSVFSQNYSQYRVVYIDDAYARSTIKAISNYVKNKGQNHRFDVIHNTQSIGLIGSLLKVRQICFEDEKIIPLCEGDFFHDNEILASINKLSLAGKSGPVYDQFLEVPNLFNCQDKSFVVVISSYNNAQYYKQNLDSVIKQTYKNYRVIYIDDASSDNTAKMVEDYININGQQCKFTLVKNSRRLGSLENVYKAILSCKPNEIIVNLDGDDTFYDESVLSYLNYIYKDSDVWMTYGQFRYMPYNRLGRAQQLPISVIESNSFRSYAWVTSAPRTFYAELFHKIKREDLLQEGEVFFQVASDLAYMFPMLEMAGKHSRFISRILYDYNRSSAINDDKVSPVLQISLDKIIREKNKYGPIEKLF